jgi:outer membrane protein OmpA-like peptidoglycan-associated protein
MFENESDGHVQDEVNRRSRGYIRWVQRSLNHLLGLRLKEDGISGNYTRSAIRSFQQGRGLKVDGIVGPHTEAAIRKALKTAALQPLPPVTSPQGPPGGAAADKICEILDQFDRDSDALKPAHRAKITHLARHISDSQRTDRPIRSVRLVGHTDPTGADDYNLALGRRRAEQAGRYLRASLERLMPGGAGGVKISVESRGEAAPLSLNASRNRRVEVCLYLERRTPRPPKPEPTPQPKPSPQPKSCSCISASLLRDEAGELADRLADSLPTREATDLMLAQHSLTSPAWFRLLPVAPGDEQDLFTADDKGHKGIEHDALQKMVQGLNCVRDIYFGNWQRDFSQLLTPSIYAELRELASPIYGLIFAMLDVIAKAEFGRPLAPVRFGTYRWEEHIDNPRGFGTALDPRTYTPIPPGKKREDEPEADRLNGFFWREDPQSRLPNFIVASQKYVLKQLDLAAQSGPTPLGREHFGNAMHTVEDFYAHSNFVELGLNHLNKREDPRTVLNAETCQPLRDSLGRYRLTTGTYLLKDTAVTIQKLLRPRLEGRPLNKPPSDLDQKIIRVLIRRAWDEAAVKFYDELIRAWKNTGIPMLAKAILAATGLPSLQRAYEELILIPLRRKIAELLRPLEQAVAEQTATKVYTMWDGPRKFPVIEISHSLLAKDDSDHCYHQAARELAIHAVRDFWREMARTWCSRHRPAGPGLAHTRFQQLIGQYMNHPREAGDWWKSTLAAGGHLSLRKHPGTRMASSPHKPCLPDPRRPQCERRLRR